MNTYQQLLLYRWDDRALSFGSSDLLDPHSHGTAELVISLGQTFQCELNNKSLRAQSVLIPPGIEHRNVHSDNVCPILYLDPEGRDYTQLIDGLSATHGVFPNLSIGARARGILQKVYADKPDADKCLAMLQVALFGNQKPDRPSLDSRIEVVVNLIKADVAQHHPIGFFAEAVHLSTDRLEHLFTQEVGVPLHRYRTWLRLKVAAKLYFEGRDLSFCAQEAGFVDASHYSRMFRKFFGSKPSKLLSERRQAQVIFG